MGIYSPLWFVGGLQFEVNQETTMELYLKNNWSYKRAGDVSQVVMYKSSKHKILSLNSSIAKK
jgi:hypothetical protein